MPDTVKALKIDVTARKLEIIELPKNESLQELYNHINCTCVGHFWISDLGVGCFYDDEFFFRQHANAGAWAFEEFEHPVLGNSILVCCDENGNNVSVMPILLDQVAEKIKWFHGL